MRAGGIVVCALALCLAGCGGGGGGGDGPQAAAAAPVNADPDAWTPGVFLDASMFAARCATPRTGIDPTTGQPFADLQGAAVDENNFLRSYSFDTYLWYDEIVDRDPGLFTTPEYFDLLKTDATTASGQPRDRAHFTLPTDVWLTLSQTGVVAGYGAEWAVVAALPPRRVVVAYTEAGSPATAPGVVLTRGAEVLLTDGVDVVNANTQIEVDAINAALFPEDAGATHQFRIRDPDGTIRDIAMTSADVATQPVLHSSTFPTATGPVGYLLFNSHVATAESALVNAVDQLRADAITDLILDLRYNGGGLLDIASELAYMIAGPGPTAGTIFEALRFNDKHPTTNPVTGQPLVPMPFHGTTQGFSVAAGQPLPTLDLFRVFVLSGPNTCSASESIMNSLRGVGVTVIQIGSTTCGKPYGFFPTDNCGTTYFTIQFQVENNAGMGDFEDGFSPANTNGAPGTVLPGCSVADDFTKALGDPAEARLAAALAYRDNQSCPVASGLAPRATPELGSANVTKLSVTAGQTAKRVWLQNRTVTR